MRNERVLASHLSPLTVSEAALEPMDLAIELKNESEMAIGLSRDAAVMACQLPDDSRLPFLLATF